MNGAERYRDWGILRYWFRAVEKYAPWVRKIHFITCGQVPEWLNLNHPKLNFVRHEDYIPHEWLPTFSSRPIELNIFRIRELSEKFVLFNDDVFLNAPVKPEDFFRNGLPRVCAGLHPGPRGIRGIRGSQMPNGIHTNFNDLITIIKNFDFDTSFRPNLLKWINLRYGAFVLVKTLMLLPFYCFTGFHETHTANAFLKSTFAEVWEKERELLETTSSHRFRDISDVNQWVMKYWQIASGKFYPISPKISKMHKPGTPLEVLLRDIKAHKYKLICHNDYAFGDKAQEIQQAYSEVFPEKSAFEV